MSARLVPLEVFVKEAVLRMRARDATVATGVACPGTRKKPCGRELQRVVPPQKMPGEMLWVRCTCPRCGRDEWLPE